jgi:hypothetical protein
MKRLFVFVLFLTAFFIGAPSARAGDKIWSAVLIATNVAKPKDPPAELRSVAGRLQKVFGYNEFDIVGSASAEVGDEDEHPLMPTKSFWLKLKARRASVKEARGGYLLNLQLYQEKRALVDTVALIAPDSPLFFRGPMHARGQILIVLQVQQGTEKKKP